MTATPLKIALPRRCKCQLKALARNAECVDALLTKYDFNTLFSLGRRVEQYWLHVDAVTSLDGDPDLWPDQLRQVIHFQIAFISEHD